MLHPISMFKYAEDISNYASVLFSQSLFTLAIKRSVIEDSHHVRIGNVFSLIIDHNGELNTQKRYFRNINFPVTPRL